MTQTHSDKPLPRPSLSITALTVANLIPLFGVILLGWDAAAIVLLYWIENLIIGLFNILRMILAKVESTSKQLMKLFFIPFFCVHFGGFCAVHGFFLISFFKIGSPDDAMSPSAEWMGPLIFLQLLYQVVMQLWVSRPPGMEWPALGLFISHGISFVKNYIIGQEYRSLKVPEIMMQPYKRVAIMHVAIIAGGFLIMMMGSPMALLCVLVFLKIGMDIWLHAKSHQKLARDEKKR